MNELVLPAEEMVEDFEPLDVFVAVLKHDQLVALTLGVEPHFAQSSLAGARKEIQHGGYYPETVVMCPQPSHRTMVSGGKDDRPATRVLVLPHRVHVDGCSTVMVE